MVVLPGVTDKQAMVVAEELRKRVAAAKTSSRSLTVSIGVSTVFSGSKSSQVMIDEADQAMYFSKRQGKNRVTHFNEGVLHVAS